MVIIAKHLKEQGKLNKDTVVVTVMSNLGLDIAFKRRKHKTVKTKVGDRYVLEEMRKSGYSIGGEQSGHVIFLDYNTTEMDWFQGFSLLPTVKASGKTFK